MAESSGAAGGTVPDDATSTLTHVTAVARYEAGKRVRGTLVLTGLLVALAALDVALYPSLGNAEVNIDDYFQSLPQTMQEMFGGVGFGTIEGFLVGEFYQFAWVLLLGMYFAYRGGGLLAEDVERDRMDLLLATPISRSSVVLGKFLSLVPVMIVLNAVLPVVVYAGVVAIGESIAVTDLIAVHLLSLPYLSACGALGLLLSAGVSTADLGRRAGLGAVFGMYLLNSVTARTTLEWIEVLTLPQYYDTAPILANGEYDVVGAAVLLAVTGLTLAVAAWWFGRRDI